MEKAPPTGIDIDPTDKSGKEELIVKLTRGQVQLVEKFLAKNMQPHGYEMIAFAYDLFNRLHKALEVQKADFRAYDPFETPEGLE